MAEDEIQGGFSNFETFTVSNIVTNYKTHAKAVNEIVDRVLAWDGEEEVAIPNLMKAVREYFRDLSDWNLAHEYWSGAEGSDKKHAMSDMFNAAMARVNWREVAAHLIELRTNQGGIKKQ